VSEAATKAAAMLEHITDARGMLDNWSREAAGDEYPDELRSAFGRAGDALDRLYDQADAWYAKQVTRQ